MLREYHRPKTLEEALEWLARPNTLPLGGGTVLNQQKDADITVVDLQALSLDKIHKSGEKLEIGATATLQSLLDYAHTPEVLKKTLRLEAPLNLRNMGTVAGALVSCDGRSPFAAAMLALDAKVTLVGKQPAQSETQGSTVISLGNLLPLRTETLSGKLITKIEILLNVQLAYEQVARTPTDKPILCAALAQWASGRTRLVIGGWGASPSLAMDGRDATGLEPAARNAAHNAQDQWASAEYRREVAAVLARRCLEGISR